MRRPVLSSGLTLSIGLMVGWASAGLRTSPLRADRDDPGFEDQLTSGPVLIQYNEGTKLQISHDAVYYLDYTGGRLVAAFPNPLQTGGTTKVLDSFVERDLVADFKLAPGARAPRFLMTTGTMGALNGAWAPLYVFESSTKQVATYRLTPQMVAGVSKPRFDLLELRSYAQPTPAQP